jgi:glycosyltransferase 2 family protein
MSKRRVLFLVAKLAFASVVLFWLLHKVDVGRVWITVHNADRLFFAAGVGLVILLVAIAGWRWHRLLRIFQIDIPLPSLIGIAWIGQFFAMFLPGQAGDDVTRMVYISRLTKGRVGEACTTVVLDRIIGLVSVVVLALFCMPWNWKILASSRETYWLALAIVIAGAGVFLFGTVFFIAGHPTHKWFEKRLRALPAHNLRDELARIWGLLCARKAALSQVIGAAVATQLILCVLFFLAGLAVGIHVSFLTWLSFVPVVLASNALPITVAGLGVREYLLVLFLAVIAQVEGESALAASFVSFAMILVVCLLGGLLYIFYRPRPKTDDYGQGQQLVALDS